MPLEEYLKRVQENSIIPNESGIVKKMGGGFFTPSPFATEHLFYCIWSDEYLCSPQYSVRRNFLDSLLLIHLLHGTMDLEYEGKSYIMTEGSIAFLDLRKPHYYGARTEMQFRMFLIDGSITEAYYRQIHDTIGVVFQAHVSLNLVFGRLQDEMISMFPDEHRISYLLHQIFGRLVSQDRPGISPAVLQARNYITRHFQDPITLDMIADSAALSKYHLSRIFKEETGFSPHEYLSEVRLRFAKQLLTETTHSVEDIAVACGYSSATHFVRAFRTANQITPAKFRSSFDPTGVKHM